MQEIFIYNSLTREKERFLPLEDGFMGMYVCGPTVYGDPHLGHAKSYISFDIIVRYFRYLGYKVRYVQNITDVGHLTDDADDGEDKLARQSRIEKLEPMELAEKYTFRYFRDMDRLNVVRPNISPRASGHIPEQISIIQRLLSKGYAYESGGNVYFDVSSFAAYGKLSGRKMDRAESGSRISVSTDKKHPADFALWKKAGSGHIMKWDSPWGSGFPGWHVECSAMAMKYLGETIDIHGGGLENQFPHHECEIAQCEGATEKPFARYWIHNNMVTLNGQKMGKSLGNAISLEQFFTGEHPLLTRSWDPMVIRFFLLQSHYRSTTDFSESALTSAENGYRNLLGLLNTIHQTAAGQIADSKINDADSQPSITESQGVSQPREAKSFDLRALQNELMERMSDDFNTARAIACLFEQLRPLQGELLRGNVPGNIGAIHQFVSGFCSDVLGFAISPDPTAQENDYPFDQVMRILLDIRDHARKNRDWALADQIRDRLAASGIGIEDGPRGTSYKIS